jgi:hypothetical protein
MPFPKTKSELEAAGYRFSNSGQCSARICLAPIEWYRTPKGKKMPFDLAKSDGIMEPHFATCPAVKQFGSRK